MKIRLGRVRMWVAVWLKFAAYVAVFWATFHFIFDFSNQQAFGLGLVLSVGIDLAASRKGPASTPFRPYLFGVYPHIGHMLVDLGLVTDEKFKEAVKDVPPYYPWTNKHIFYYPIRAFVISCEPGGKSEVIHFPELGYYMARLDVAVKIEQFEFPGSLFAWSPEFFVKGAGGGYGFGIRVKEEWWKENKPKVAAGVVLDEDHEYNFGQVRLTLAILPYEVIIEFYVTTMPTHQERVKELVAKRGWKNEPRGGELPYFGESYNHKYVDVWTNDLE